MTDRYVRPVVLAWEDFKVWLSPAVHLTHYQLHVIVGLLLFFGFAFVLRRPPTAVLPLAPVAVLELANEASDYTRYAIDNYPWTPRETLIDIALTLGPPICVILVARVGSAVRGRAGDVPR